MILISFFPFSYFVKFQCPSSVDVKTIERNRFLIFLYSLSICLPTKKSFCIRFVLCIFLILPGHKIDRLQLNAFFASRRNWKFQQPSSAPAAIECKRKKSLKSVFFFQFEMLNAAYTLSYNIQQQLNYKYDRASISSGAQVLLTYAYRCQSVLVHV